MAYLTDEELLKRFEYYSMQLENQLTDGQDFYALADQVPFAVHLNDSKTLEIKNSNEIMAEITGFHNDEISEMGSEYLENYLHPTTLSNISEFLPPIYQSMKAHHTFPFVQYVKQYKDKDFSPFVTFTKSTTYKKDLVLCLSLRPKDFDKMSPKMEKVVEMDYFKMMHFKQYQQLSEREVEVLKLLASGKNNPEIASLLYISRLTVETHRKNIIHKLGLTSFRDLIRYALAFGLVSI